MTNENNRRHPIIQADIENIVRRAGSALDTLEGKSILITGALGMLASYLTETIACLNETRFEKPCKLYGLIRKPLKSSDYNGYLLKSPGIEFIIGDARQLPPVLPELNYIVLAATKGSPLHYLGDPIGTLELNGSSLHKWLKLAIDINCGGVLYFSSGEIYGTPDPEAVPTPENYIGRFDTLSPRAVYGEGKRYGETLCMAFHRQYGLDVKIVRPFQIFGPGVKPGDGRAMPDFLYAAAANEDIVLTSAGAAKRTFMYIADAAVAFWKILQEGEPGSVFNVGSPEPELTILQLAEKIAEISGGKSRMIVKGNTHPLNDAPSRTCPSIEKLSQKLNFNPEYSIDDLISRTIDWIRSTSRIN